MSDLVGKNILLYFGGVSIDCTPKIREAYREIKTKDNACEMIFISVDDFYAEYQSYFDEIVSSLQCLALPYNDYVRNMRLNRWFGIRSNSAVIFISSDGHTYRDDALELISTHRGDIYPFTPERFDFLKQQYEETERNQTLASLLVSDTRDYLVSNDGSQVKLFFISTESMILMWLTLIPIFRFLSRNSLEKQSAYVSVAAESLSLLRHLPIFTENLRREAKNLRSS